MLQFLLAPEAWVAFAKVVMIDLVLAGDNAIVIGMAAAGLAKSQRARAIWIGIGAATVLRIIFAFVALKLLQIVGLALVGGFLLLWVCWKMYRELSNAHSDADEVPLTGEDYDHDGEVVGGIRPKTLHQAAMQIVVADVSMSLDNVLAVAGAAVGHPYVLVGGLVLSVALMGLAASLIANLLGRFRWIGWLGLAIIFYVAVEMIYRGSFEVMPHLASFILI